jgi:hypothetical protein
MKYLLLLCMSMTACDKITKSQSYISLVNMVPRDTYKSAANLLGVERDLIVALSFKKVENHRLIVELVHAWDAEVLERAKTKLEKQLGR